MDDDPGGKERCLTNRFQSATLTRFHLSLKIGLPALKQTSRGCFIYCTTQRVSFSLLCNIYWKSGSHPAYQHLFYTKVFYAIESHQISHNLASDRTQIFQYNDKGAGGGVMSIHARLDQIDLGTGWTQYCVTGACSDIRSRQLDPFRVKWLCIWSN